MANDDQPSRDKPSPEWMLDKLSDKGDNSGSDYDDSVDGWFGWTVDADGPEPILEVSWTPDSDKRPGPPTVTTRWRLVRDGA
jgi:hypothetical protein